MMTLVSLADCCRKLCIDSKTLHRWLKQAHIPVQPHPMDTRCKCLTLEQIQQIAVAHHRSLHDAVHQHLPAPISALRDVGAHPSHRDEQIADLQAQVATLQSQLSQLTELLQKVQIQEPKASATAAHKQEKKSQDKSQESSQDKSPKKSQDKSQESSQDKSSKKSQDKSKPLSAASTDRRKQVVPLVEYAASRGYVVICPKLGMLDFQPDSPEWFAWLATQSSFRFVGALGHLTAYRGKDFGPDRAWRACRHIRNHVYNYALGKTQSLTVTLLEQAAASLQSHLN
jgi:hypothetical protein